MSSSIAISDLSSVLLGVSIGVFAVGLVHFLRSKRTVASLWDSLFKHRQSSDESIEVKIQRMHLEEAKERSAALREIRQDIRKISDETRALGGIFRSDIKSQGDFGEFVLERLLESSGLRAGVDFLVQDALSSQDGGLRPDVRVMLPGDRSLIIDSKVSLAAWDRFVRAGSDLEQAEALEAHIECMRRHIRGLSEKHYERAEQRTEYGTQSINTPDFVFLFTPIESAWIEVIRFEPTLLEEAWGQKVVVVSPTTLFSALKTVSSLWVRERQNVHAREIAIETERLFTEFTKYWSELESVEKDLRKTLMRVENARRRSADVTRQIEALRLNGGLRRSPELSVECNMEPEL